MSPDIIIEVVKIRLLSEKKVLEELIGKFNHPLVEQWRQGKLELATDILKTIENLSNAK